LHKAFKKLVGCDAIVDTEWKSRLSNPAHQADEFTAMERGQRSELQKWKVHSAQTRSKMKVPHDFRPWAQIAHFHGVPSGSERARELIEVGYVHVDKEAQRRANFKKNPQAYKPGTLIQGFWCDISQAVQRKPFGSLGVLHTNAWFYSYEHDIVLPGLFHVALNGFPSDLNWSMFGHSAISQHAAARQLMGESFSLPCGAQALTAAMLTKKAPWWEPR
jgi:hypothetical protein